MKNQNNIEIQNFFYVPNTKFIIPEVKTSFMLRKELESKLIKTIKKKLTLVVAPAGYGKTTSISGLVKRRLINQVNWISLWKEDQEEEVINFQEPSVRAFLIKTAILKNLNKSICEYVTGFSASASILEKLVTDKLFITCLDDRNENYQYHSLLSEVLIVLLNKEYKEQVRDIYSTAGLWCEEHNLYGDAFYYYQGANDKEKILSLLEKYYHSKKQEVIPSKRICEYFELLHCGTYNRNPGLSIRYALAMAETGQLDKEEKVLLEKGIDLNNSIYEPFDGQISNIRIYIALKYENIAELLLHSIKSLEHLPEEEIITTCLILGYIYRSLADIKKAEEYFTKANLICEKMKVLSGIEVVESRVLSDFYIKSIRYLKGELKDFITPTKRLLTENITHKNCMYFCLANTYYDYGDLQNAYDNVRKGLELCNTYKDIFYEKVKGLTLLSKIFYAFGKKKEAVLALEEIDQLMNPNSGNMFILLELPRIINLLTALGLTERAEKYINKFNGLPCEQTKYIISETQAELLFAKKNYSGAISLLEQMEPDTIYQLYPKKRMDIFLLLSLAYQEAKEDEKAMHCLYKVFEFRDCDRYVRAFKDRGDRMRDLLEKFIPWLKKQSDTAFVDKTEKLRDSLYTKGVLIGTASSLNMDLLSKREQEVLRLLAGGFSYQEIGGKLFISLSTVKKHTGNIYEKLMVKNRGQAVKLANEYHLI